MKNNAFSSVYWQALFACFSDPLCYVTALATILVCALRFFIPFFTVNGSADLRPFFSAVPAVSVFVVPLILFRLRGFIADDSLPLPPFVKHGAITAAAFTAFAFPLILLLALPLCVHSFGDVEAGQLAAGYAGVFLYGWAACALCLFLFSALPFAPAVSLLASALVLLLVNTVHLLSQYIPAGEGPGAALGSFLLQKLSFAWHFDAAGKGIFDSRDIFFYLFAAFIFLLLSVACEYRRTGRAFDRRALFLLALIVICGGTASYRLYARLDATASRRFSVSKSSRELCALLEEPLRITYYRSKELRSLYPQTVDVAEYLAAYTQQDRHLSLEIRNVSQEEARRLQSMGIQGTQIRSMQGSRTEYVTVYSAVVMAYLDQELILPLVLSTRTLEYDLTRRVQDLVSGRTRDLYVISGNGFPLEGGAEDGYGYVLAYLERQGFVPHVVPAGAVSALVEPGALGPGSQLLVLGSSLLTAADAAALEHLVKSGIPAFIATSPYSVAIADDWAVSKAGGDALIPALRSWGFAFENALAQDLACFPLSLQSGSGSQTEYQTVNYPQWITLAPQPAAPSGMTLFWASPLSLYGETSPLLLSSASAWTQQEAADKGAASGADLFIVNPFLLPKTAREAGAPSGSLVLAARADDGSGSALIHGYYETGEARARVTVLSDQYFVSSLMTAYISGQSGGDFRNFDFLTSQLLSLRGDDQLARLLQKKPDSQPLYKITDSESFARERLRTLVLIFVLLPLLVCMLAGFVRIRRRAGR